MSQPAMAGRRLTVEADLRLDLGGRPARLTGSGAELTLLLSDPAGALAQVRAAVLPGAVRLSPRRVGQLADQLQAAGLRLTVRGPRGTLLVLGRGGGSRLLRLVTGSRHVGLGRARVLVPTLAGAVSLRARRDRRT